MTIEEILDVHERQHPELRTVVSRLRGMLVKASDITEQRFVPVKANTMLVELRRATADGVVEAIGEIRAAIRREAEAEIRQADAARANRPTNGYVDPTRFSAAHNAAEIGLLLRAAEASGVDALRIAWAYGRPVLEALARREMRLHQLPSSHSALNTLTVWGARVGAAGRRDPDGPELRDRARRREQELVTAALAAARVVGLDALVAQRLRQAEVADATQ